MRVLERSPQRIALGEENVSPVRALGLTVFRPTALQTVVFAQRQTNDVWGLYILARIDRQASSFVANGHEASTANRALALFRYLADIPTDAEPPAAMIQIVMQQVPGRTITIACDALRACQYDCVSAT
ncbi:hypothetical protein [Paraburkholderia kirstenboschensis]